MSVTPAYHGALMLGKFDWKIIWGLTKEFRDIEKRS